MNTRIVTVFGGTGFVGKVLVGELAKAGYMVNVVSRFPELVQELKVAGPVGKVVLSKGDVKNNEDIKRSVKGSHVVINLVGLLFEKGKQTFERIHVDAARDIATAAREAGADKFIQMSALGVDKNIKSEYARTKLEGEKAVREAFPGAIVIRPSIIFGEGDSFFNKFSRYANIMYFLPLIGGGNAKFQPVYVKDVARAMVKAIKLPDSRGKTYELGGPKIYSFKELLELMLAETNRRRILVPIPFWLAKFKAFFLEMLPVPPLTIDQVKLLEYDNVVSPEAHGINELGILPLYVETVIPGYLSRFKRKSSISKFA